MNLNSLTYILLSLIILFPSCQDPWDERTTLNDDVPVNNLMQEIESNPDLSVFAQYLKDTGWDTLLSDSKIYTVWAPTNDALSDIDASLTNSAESLLNLVNYHICYSRYNFFAQEGTLRLNTFRDKYLTLDYTNGKTNDISLLEPLDIATNNGVLHIIDDVLIPKMNVWEVIESVGDNLEITKYLTSFTGEIFDATIATQVGVDANTGKPVYDTATGLLWDNVFLNYTRNLRNEDTLSTVFLFSDTDFQNEFDKFRKYYLMSDASGELTEKTDSSTNWKITKDIVVAGEIPEDELPDTIKSLFEVGVATNSFIIDSVYQASNGYVYFVNNYSIELSEKIRPIIIEAEDTNKYIGRDDFGKTGFTRQVPLASGGYDFVLDDHGAAIGTLTYELPDELCICVYQVYMQAVNDFDYSYAYPSETDTIWLDINLGNISEYEDDEPVFDVDLVKEDIAVTDTSYTNASLFYVDEQNITTYNQYTHIQVAGISKNSTVAFDYIKLVPKLNE